MASAENMSPLSQPGRCSTRKYSLPWNRRTQESSKGGGGKSAVIQLYLDPSSHPSRAVDMAVRIIGSQVERHYLDLFANDQFREDYLKLNPLHRVPFIVDGDLKLGESRTIMRYLADRDLPPNNTFYPHDLKQRAKIDEILDFDSGTLCTLIYDLFGPRFFGLSEELDKYGEHKLDGFLTYLENRLKQNGGKKFMIGDHITIADIALVASLSVVDLCEYDLSVYSRLDEYLRKLSTSIPHYEEVNAKGLTKYRDIMKILQG